MAIDILLKGELHLDALRGSPCDFYTLPISPYLPRVNCIEIWKKKRTFLPTLQKGPKNFFTTSGLCRLFRLYFVRIQITIEQDRHTHATDSGIMKSVNAPPIILRLPLEILEVFIAFSSVSSQLSLARVSQFFHSLALRSLYRDIALCSPNAVVTCCRTLAAKPVAALSVRSLLITYA